jgi:hypothetical protein
MASAHSNMLLVEGIEERLVVPHLMDHYVVWGDTPDEWVVFLKAHEGVDDLLEPGNIEAESKQAGLKAIGILIDADDQFDSRWSRPRDRCLRIAADFPEQLPPDGLIHQNEDGLRIGVWIMPDNQSRGMLETFLGSLVTAPMNPLWIFARESCTNSRDHGAPYIDPHYDKACIYTFLAWLEPPGRSLNVSVQARAFDGRLPLAGRFAKWFINLYQLVPRSTLLP